MSEISQLEREIDALTNELDSLYKRLEEKPEELADEANLNCLRASEIMKGCVVKMSSSSGLKGYGNAQCVSSVCDPLGEISLYGHNQLYKTRHVAEVLEYPFVETD